MATRIVRTDDVNGDEGANPVVITVDGRGVAVDLAERSIKGLTAALAEYWAAGTERDYDVELAHQARASARRSASERGYDLAELRAWADRNGTELPQRGRIPADIVKRYLAA